MTEDQPSIQNQKAIAALRLGWNIARFYNTSAPPWNNHRDVIPKNQTRRLPSSSKMSAKEQAQVLLNLVATDIATLGIETKLLTGDDYATKNDDAFRDLLDDSFVEIHTELTSMGGQLDIALSLGHILADTTFLPKSGKQDDMDHCFKPERLENAHEWLNALNHQLPNGAADAVNGSLASWEHYVSQQKPALDTAFTRALRAQGTLWMQLLCGDKPVANQLRAEDYAHAVERLISQFRTAALGYVKRWQWWMLVAVLALVIAGIVIGLVTNLDALKFLGLTAAGLGTIGISWKTIGSAASHTLTTVKTSLWEAELKEAAIQACTIHTHWNTQNNETTSE